MSDALSVVIAGLQHAAWHSYSVDSDLRVAADAWSVSVSGQTNAVPAVIKPGASMVIRVGDTTILNGLVDDVSREVAKGQHALTLRGRDLAGVLVDSSASIFTEQQMALRTVIDRVVKDLLPDVRYRIDADRALTRDRVSTDPGETAWDLLQRAAEANGLWPWFEPDGTLVVGGPDYTTEPVGTLALRGDGRGNNVLSLVETRSQVGRYSQVTVLGQAGAFGERAGRHDVKAVLRDNGVNGKRPRIVMAPEATDESLADARGRKLISDGRLNGCDLRATVAGHRAPNGELWSAGQRVHVVSEPHGLDEIYFLIARRIACDRFRGPTTELTLKEDGIWGQYAYPKKRKRHKGKGSPQGAIINLATGE